VHPEDIAVFVPHQANLRIIEAVTRRLGLRNAEVAADIVRTGNTSAASIPMALDAMTGEGRAPGGRLALLVGFGAGLAHSAQVVTLPACA
jgi:3-oxoacyl-[acyl-carrier-protein] synthase-3